MKLLLNFIFSLTFAQIYGQSVASHHYLLIEGYKYVTLSINSYPVVKTASDTTSSQAIFEIEDSWDVVKIENSNFVYEIKINKSKFYKIFISPDRFSINSYDKNFMSIDFD